MVKEKLGDIQKQDFLTMNLLDNRVIRRIIFSDLYPKTQIVEDISDGSRFSYFAELIVFGESCLPITSTLQE